MITEETRSARQRRTPPIAPRLSDYDIEVIASALDYTLFGPHLRRERERRTVN